MIALLSCERCGQVVVDPSAHGLYVCPLETVRVAAAVRADSIPGGLTIEHGLCNDDGTPRTFYSQSEITAACEQKGMRRWSDYHSADKTKPAEQLAEWSTRSGEAARLTRDNREREREARR